MVNSSCRVIDGIEGICMVSSEHEVDFLSSSIEVLEDVGSVVKTHTQVSLRGGERREGGREEKEKKRERERERERNQY